MNRHSLPLTLLMGSLLMGNACAQGYSFSIINDGLQPTTIRRPHAINDAGLILLQPYSAFNTSMDCLLINGSSIQQTEQYPGTDQYYSLSSNGYITGTGIYGVFYLDDIKFNLNIIPVPKGDTGYPTGINSSQLVVGMANSPTKGTYGWTSLNGSFTKFVYPGSTGCTLNGINDGGDMVGTYFTGNLHTNYYAFAIVEGKRSEIVVPGCVDPTPSAISNTGIVVGSAISESSKRMVGFVRGRTGTVSIMDFKPYVPASITDPSGAAAKLSSYYGSEVFGVNSSGVIVGTFTGTYISADGAWAETQYFPIMATPK